MNITRFSLLLVVCAVAACGPEPPVELSLSSPTKGAGTFVVTLDRASLTTSGAANLAWVFSTEEQDTLVTQYSDMDGDGTWDWVLVEVPFAQNNATLIGTPVEWEAKPEFPQATNLHLGFRQDVSQPFESIEEYTRPGNRGADRASNGYHFQMEGPAWENDKIAFRHYFDTRNGFDIFGKRTSDLVLEDVGTGENYHKLADWGMDVLKVGSSMGAGAFALLSDGRLVPVRNTGEVRATLLEEGPLCSRLRLAYADWQVGDGRTLDAVQTIAIFKGEHGYHSTVELVGGTDQDTLAVGFVNLHDLDARYYSSEYQEGAYTYGLQSENKDTLGMAVIVPKQRRAGGTGIYAAPEEAARIVNSYYVKVVPDLYDRYTYSFVAGWPLSDEQFGAESGFKSYLRNWYLREIVLPPDEEPEY